MDDSIHREGILGNARLYPVDQSYDFDWFNWIIGLLDDYYWMILFIGSGSLVMHGRIQWINLIILIYLIG